MRTLGRLFRACLHSILLFALPWGIGAGTGLFFDASEVGESLGAFGRLYLLLVLPALILQFVGVSAKVARERKSRRALGRWGFPAFVEALDRHVRVLTPRGMGMLGVSLVMVVVALAAKWAQFGVLAVTGVGLIYGAVTAAVFISAFRVRSFDERLHRADGTIERELSPAVIDTGDPTEERFYLRHVPIPFGFRLHIHDVLPERLQAETRFVADPKASKTNVQLSAQWSRTPRGEYPLGPATIWFEDVFGLTRVYVASQARAFLRVLPKFRPLVFSSKPKTLVRAEGTIVRASRMATDEWFHVRPYVPGDDARRIHWKASIKTGALQIRQPETVPYARRLVRLVLDTYMVPALGDAEALAADLLDLMVDGWLSLAREFALRGERVTLCAALREGIGDTSLDGASNQPIKVQELECKRGEERRWRAMGAGAGWQHSVDLQNLFNGDSGSGALILISCGFGGSRMPMAAGSTLLVVNPSDFEKPAESVDARAPWLLTYRYPAGAQENRFDLLEWFRARRRRKAALQVPSMLACRVQDAVQAARASRAMVWTIRRRGWALALEQV